MADHLFNIPDDWKWMKMGEISEVIGGGTPKTSISEYFANGDIPWLTPADLSNYELKYVSKGARNITDLGLSKSSARLLPKGTVLFTSRAPIGYVAIASNEIATNQGFKSFVLDGSIAESEFVYYWLKANKELAESYANGATFLELSGKKAKILPIPIPPISEQKRIVEKLDALLSRIDHAIKELTESLELADDLFASSLNEAFNPLGSIKNAEGVYELPEGWEWRKIGEIADLLGGATPSKRNPEYWKGDINWASVRDLNVDILTETEFKITIDGLRSCSTNLIEPNNVIIATRVGLGKVVINKIPTAINQDLKGVIPSKDVQLKYLYNWFKSIASHIEDNGTGATVKGVKIGFIKSLNIPIPPITEQERITQQLESLSYQSKELNIQLQSQLGELQDLKASLLDAAFRGEL